VTAWSLRAFQGPISALRKKKGVVPHSEVQLSWDGEQHRFLYLLSHRCGGVGLGEAPPILSGELALDSQHSANT